MRKLIDANKLPLTPIDMTDLPSDKCLMVYLADDVDNATAVLTIPDNPTNGDVQTAMLKPYEIMKGESYVLIYLTKEQREQHHWECWFDLEWWNSPYKGAEHDRQDE